MSPVPPPSPPRSPSASGLIECPSCHVSFELSAAIRDALQAELRVAADLEVARRVADAVQREQADAGVREARLAAERDALAAKVTEASARQVDLLRAQRELEQKARDADLRVEERVRETSAQIADKARVEAEARVTADLSAVMAAKDREIADGRSKLTAASKKEAELLRKERSLDERAQQQEVELERRLSDERARLTATAEKGLRARFEAQLAEEAARGAAERADTARRLSEGAAREAKLAQAQREADERARQASVDAERKLALEVTRIHVDAERLAREKIELTLEQHTLRERELQQQMQRMNDQIVQLRTANERQKSQEAQGEAQETLLRDQLVAAFGEDGIDDVPVGTRGADLLQRVGGSNGGGVGTIIWESKRTQAWSPAWLPKLRDDQREAKADCAIIVTQALPADVKTFAYVGGVWVCSWACAVPLAAALRAGMREVAAARRATEGKGEKAMTMYAYLTGNDFRLRVTGVVEAFTEMQDDLVAEERAIRRTWQKRAKQLDRALSGLAGMYGDMQGLAGRQLPDLPALSLEGGELDETAPCLPAQRCLQGDADGELVDLLDGLVPSDGSGVGNGSLMARFIDRARERLGVAVGEATYWRCRDALVASGRAVKGRGRGGSVVRA